MKLIFLDIDGVLNSIRFHRGVFSFGESTHPSEFKTDIEYVALGLLKYIVKETGASIVISSTWRIGKTPEWFIEGFRSLGWANAPIIGLTRVSGGVPRGKEVAEYLKDNYTKEPRYVILDDDGDFNLGQNLFQTNVQEGLSMQMSEDVIEFLNKTSSVRALNDIVYVVILGTMADISYIIRRGTITRIIQRDNNLIVKFDHNGSPWTEKFGADQIFAYRQDALMYMNLQIRAEEEKKREEK